MFFSILFASTIYIKQEVIHKKETIQWQIFDLPLTSHIQQTTQVELQFNLKQMGYYSFFYHDKQINNI